MFNCPFNPIICREDSSTFSGCQKSPVDFQTIRSLDDFNFEKISIDNFKKLNKEPAAMIAHIVYNKIDKDIACCSKEIIKKIIRKKIGFKGLLISDDINELSSLNNSAKGFLI